MYKSFTSELDKKAIPIMMVDGCFDYLKRADNFIKKAVQSQKFNAKSGETCFVYDSQGSLSAILVGQSGIFSMWDIAHLPRKLSKGIYKLSYEWGKEPSKIEKKLLLFGWGLGFYETKLEKSFVDNPIFILLEQSLDIKQLKVQVESISMARDLINVPPNLLTPYELASYVQKRMKRHKIKVHVIKDQTLEKKNFPLIYAVGKGSENPPCLIDFSWGDKKYKKVTLVGKGVTFDTGGLDLKPSSNMVLMKKDMGGAAAVLALAEMLIASNAKINLRVLIPSAENSVDGSSFRPQDIFKSRKGTSIEIGNTDAEGRLVMADSFSYAMEDKPDLLIDFSTLTGAGRVALGFDVPALFGNDPNETRRLSDLSLKLHDPLWHMPLWHDYMDQLDSYIADISNNGPGYGGAITAALFLNHFVDEGTRWFHVDLMGWHQKARPGRPIGGDVIGVRAMHDYILNMIG